MDDIDGNAAIAFEVEASSIEVSHGGPAWRGLYKRKPGHRCAARRRLLLAHAPVNVNGALS